MKVVLVGVGMVADTHLAALADLGEKIDSCALVGRSVERTKATAVRAETNFGLAPTIYDTLQDCLEKSPPDFAILATPPNARKAYVDMLSAKGIHILSEKPLERTCSVAEEIVQTCAAAKVKLGVVLQHRMRPDVALLRDHIEKGALGQVTHLDIRVPWWRDQSYYAVPGRGTYGRDGGGVLISQAIHTLDLALSFAGPLRAVQAMTTTTPSHQMEAEDWASASLRFQSGAVANFLATTAAFPGGSETISIFGTAGAAHLRPGQLELIDAEGNSQMRGAASGSGGGADPMAFTHDWHRAIVEDFVDAIEVDRNPAVTGTMALDAHRAIDAMERASATGQRVEL